MFLFAFYFYRKGREQKHVLLFRKSSPWGCYKLRHVTKRDMLLFKNSKILDFEVAISNMPLDFKSLFLDFKSLFLDFKNLLCMNFKSLLCMDFKILLCLDFSILLWILKVFFGFQKSSLYGFQKLYMQA
jgi:hypothetical protein